jgi:hypothetical protein
MLKYEFAKETHTKNNQQDMHKLMLPTRPIYFN